MNMNSVKVHTFNKTSIAKQGQSLLASIVMSALLTACGGSSGPSAEELAAQAAIAAQAAADKAAADAAIAAAIAKAAADKAAADAKAAADKAAADAKAEEERQAKIAAARKDIKDSVGQVETDTKAAQSASAIAGYSLLQAKQQASAYAEVANTLAKTQAFADQAKQAAEQALAQKALATTAATSAESAETLEAVTAFAQQAKNAALRVKEARTAAEQARDATQKAADQVSAEVKIAEAARRYTKLDSGGNELPLTANAWSCLKDKQTGLVWEMKTSDGSFRDKTWRYRHMHNYGGYGNTVDTKGQVLCRGLDTCDAYSYMNAVNGQGLCGRNSWRIPLKSELGSIAQINAGGTPPHINQEVFPDIVYKPREAAYCAMNTNAGADAEHNYQGVDYGLPLLNGIQTKENLENSILVPLRYYGEISDGLVNNPGNASNWICYTRMVSSR
ncbi:MAG: hypothetical protein BWK73_11410 [Thiothrix lacustris]|uniref:Lcl C-terminal domain-containing protein n=1 Tax=Thiothrix lacustris TaxID=525917 RepID=A0A1Y1QUD5_9GAMM|nr:MAG: hypothetical protein BWK73_11410 [Thiothrix lacustris]